MLPLLTDCCCIDLTVSKTRLAQLLALLPQWPGFNITKTQAAIALTISVLYCLTAAPINSALPACLAAGLPACLLALLLLLTQSRQLPTCSC